MKELLKECIQLGYLTDEFTSMALDIACGQIHRKKNIPIEVRNDAVSDFSIKLVRKWELIDPDKYPKSYVSSMASSCLMDILRKFEKQIKNYDHIKEHEERQQNFEKRTTILNVEIKSLTRKERSKARMHIIRLLKKGHGIREVSIMTGIRKATIIKWNKLYKEHGIQSYMMDNRKNNGRKKITGQLFFDFYE